MDREVPTDRTRYENPVVAALETIADRRRNGSASADTGANADGASDPIDRTVALIEAASARIEAGDYSIVEAVCVGQALALDVIFDQFARRSANGDRLFHDSMKMAFRAQLQCRRTLKTLIALKNPKQAHLFRKQTDENGNSPA